MGLQIFTVSRICALAHSAASIMAEMSERFPSEGSQALVAVSTAAVEGTDDRIRRRTARRKLNKKNGEEHHASTDFNF